MNKMKKSVVLLSFLLLTTACSSGKTEEIKIEDNRYYPGFQALDQGNWEEAAELFGKNTEEETGDITPYIGLARAQIGADNLEEAKEALIKAAEIDPKAENVLFYLGEVSQKLEDYDLAADCYDSLMELKPEDGIVKERLVDYIWKIDDDEKRYDISLKIYEQDNTYLQNLLWACAAWPDGQKMDSILKLIENTDSYYAVKALYESYQAVKDGDQEKAESILFDNEKAEQLFMVGKLYYGECDSRKNMNGIAVGIQTIFDEKGAIIGNCKDGYWEGECTAWNVDLIKITSRSNGVERKGKGYNSNTYRGLWQKGRPEGEILHELRFSRQYDDEPQPYHTERVSTRLNFSNGGAQGETVTQRFYYSNYKQMWEDMGTIHHVFADGEPTLFEIDTYEGKKEVYEARMNNGHVTGYDESPCDCSYIWK